ncbi:MAG: cation diffusion facilitator family transporter [Actinobacteria bacterium]|nr:cation diffusion facilitator family transporter [Actinomycetota bacterium]MCA1722431.1 cation diffusion facilitator family transporter [Actinomycetota bacterium]
MSAGGGKTAILAALGANLAIAVAKFVGFLITASSSLLAESVHSLADSGNQVLLLVGQKRGAREADERHPFGYGRDRYFYSFVVALVLFSLGSLFALYEGYEKVHEPHELDSPVVAFGILIFAILAEGFSFRTAIRESRPGKGSGSWVQFIKHSKAPELPVVLLEDLAALVGLVLALAGVTLAVVLDQPVWDGIGTLAIGVLLGIVAAVLAVEMKALLIGEAASPAAVDAIRGALVDGQAITRVIHLKTLHLGPEELLVAAKIAVAPGLTLPAVARAIDDAEARVRAVEPLARTMYLEPDLDRGGTP